MMHPDFKTQIVAALRSGQYTQAQSRLRTEEGFCCLGVICDIFKDRVQGEWKQRFAGTWYFQSNAGNDRINDTGKSFMGTYISEETNYLPDHVREMIGLDIDKESQLIDMNDSGKSFMEIAQHIEQDL